MSDERPAAQRPFKSLGRELRKMREQARESIADVSGAVEIDVHVMVRIELGQDRPSEDVLMLLVSHFGIEDEVATNLWELAGYSDDNGEVQVTAAPIDIRVVYTDMINVMVNDFGVVMNFLQSSGPSMQPLAIARVGMSREQALSVLKVLQATLQPQSQQPKLLKDKNKETN